MTDSRELTLIADGARMLAEARSLLEVRDVRSLAIAATAFARARDLGEDAVRSANRIVILSTARLGEELIAGQARGEMAEKGHPVNVGAADISSPATLSDIGISRDLSATAQRLARSPEIVREYLDHAPMRIRKRDAGLFARASEPIAPADGL